MNRASLPQFVAVGHVCQDILANGRRRLGGSVSYAAMTAVRLGYRVGVVTSSGPELDLARLLPGIETIRHPAAETTLFENIDLKGGRTQILHQRAGVITCDHVPPAWRSVQMAYLGSIAQEIAPSVFGCFADSVLVGLTPQGFFRTWDEEGRVTATAWAPAHDLLSRVHLLVVSELDVAEIDQWVCLWQPRVPVLVVTQAERGATVYCGNRVCHHAARPVNEVDATGAGDVFAAAFLIRLAETQDPCQAASFANAVASLSVEGSGVTGIPWRSTVDAYLARAE